MPNWCSNTLMINGDEKTIAKIKRTLLSLRPEDKTAVERAEEERDRVLQRTQDDKERELLRREYDIKIQTLRINSEHIKVNKGVFFNLIGLPDGVSQEEYNSNWYDNNVNWFGTKWDIDFDEWQWDFGDNYISVNFETAWSPPCPFVSTLVRKYTGITEVELTYEECGCDFAGKMVVTRDENTGEIYENDNCHSYEEGLYLYDNEYFWMRVEEDVINDEDFGEDGTTLEEILQRYHFVDDEDKAEITRMVNERLEEIKLEANEQ